MRRGCVRRPSRPAVGCGRYSYGKYGEYYSISADESLVGQSLDEWTKNFRKPYASPMRERLEVRHTYDVTTPRQPLPHTTLASHADAPPMREQLAVRAALRWALGSPGLLHDGAKRYRCSCCAARRICSRVLAGMYVCMCIYIYMYI